MRLAAFILSRAAIRLDASKLVLHASPLSVVQMHLDLSNWLQMLGRPVPVPVPMRVAVKVWWWAFCLERSAYHFAKAEGCRR